MSYPMSELVATVERIDCLIDAFNRDWPSMVKYAEIYKLPILNSPDIPDQIQVKNLKGDEAIKEATIAFSAHHWHPAQHEATVARWPGILVLDKNIIKSIVTINDAKKYLADLFKSHVPAGSRSRIRSRLFPGRSLLQTYRKIHWSSYWPEEVSFVWAGHTTGNVKLDRQKAIDRVRQAAKVKPGHLDPGEWEAVINKEINDITRLGQGTPIRERRVVAPHPRVMLFRESNQHYDDMWHANLPIILFSDKYRVPLIRSLQDFDKNKRRKQRDTGYHYEPLVERLNLYIRHQAGHKLK